MVHLKIFILLLLCGGMWCENDEETSSSLTVSTDTSTTTSPSSSKSTSISRPTSSPTTATQGITNTTGAPITTVAPATTPYTTDAPTTTPNTTAAPTTTPNTTAAPTTTPTTTAAPTTTPNTTAAPTTTPNTTAAPTTTPNTTAAPTTTPNTTAAPTTTPYTTDAPTTTPNTTAAPTTTPNTTAAPTTTPNTTDAPTTTPNTTAAPTTTPNTTAAPTTTPNTTDAPTTTPNTTAAPTTTQTRPPPAVWISETNILLVPSSQGDTNIFVELEGPAGADVSGLLVSVTEAYQEKLLMNETLNSTLDVSGKLVVEFGTQEHWTNNHSQVQSVLIAVSTQQAVTKNGINRNGVLDFVVYATQAVPQDWDKSGLKEEFQVMEKNQLIVINANSLRVDRELAFSACSSETRGNAGLALSVATRGRENNCELIKAQSVEMKLTLQGEQCNVNKLEQSFNTSLPVVIIDRINTMRQCGLTWYMLRDLTYLPSCEAEKTLKIAVRLQVASAFQTQMDVILDAYKSLIHEQNTLPIGSRSYSVSDCAGTCFPVAPSNGGDDKVKMTIAVVVSCIAVFLVVLLLVVLYMRRKKRGILQFRMTRLDEDDDDLIGDMDDFVGSQGPTFNRYR